MLRKPLIFLVLNLIFFNASADFQKRDVKRVPLIRLITNLERIKNEDPENAHNYYAIGRLYCMAFAQKSDSLESIPAGSFGEVLPHYGMEGVQYNFFHKVKSPKDSLQKVITKQYLDVAIGNFQKALELDREDIASQLGIGWCYQQKGDTALALRSYQAVINLSGSFGSSEQLNPESYEAYTYMIQLNDSVKSVETYKDLKRRISNYTPGYIISPILIPLEDGLSFEELVDRNAKVDFDLDGSGHKTQWQWIKEKAAWLVYIDNPCDKVESGRQLFGNASFNISWKNGFEALSALDNNHNGKLEQEELKNLQLWNDKNSDGKSSGDELVSLDEAGILALEVKAEEKGENLLYNSSGVVLKSGKTRALYDWWVERKAL